GISQYLTFFHGFSANESKAIAVGITVLTVALLFRRIEGVARLVNVFWGVMLVTVAIEIVATFTPFDAGRAFDFPTHAFTFSPGFCAGLGSGLVVAIYDYLGYFTAAYVGDEVRDPGYVIPRATIFSVLAVCAIYLAMNIGIMGVVPWREAEKSDFIGSEAIDR